MQHIKNTTSVCSGCLTKVPARVGESDGRVVLEKTCPTHGRETALLADDARHYYRAGPGEKGGCGESGCSFFDNHSCTLMFEITEQCNLTCPTCFTSSSPAETWRMSLGEFDRKLTGLLDAGKTGADLIQISGGEPTTHPDFERMIELAFERGVKKVYLNTNGVRLGKEPELCRRLGQYREALQIYLQFDGLRHDTHDVIRGAKGIGSLKEKAVENALEFGIFVMPVMTVTRGVNTDEIGDMVRFVRSRHPKMNTLMLQPAMYAGRYMNHRFFQRVTVSELAREVERQTDGLFSADDFGPIPCSDPNCFSCAIAITHDQKITPISRYFPKYETWSDPDVAARLSNFENRLPMHLLDELADDEIVDELLELLSADDDGQFFQNMKNFFVVAIKPFQDANCYDQHRVDKCCTHVVDRDGHPVSLCEYNTLRRPRGLL